MDEPKHTHGPVSDPVDGCPACDHALSFSKPGMQPGELFIDEDGAVWRLSAIVQQPVFMFRPLTEARRDVPGCSWCLGIKYSAFGDEWRTRLKRLVADPIGDPPWPQSDTDPDPEAERG